MVLLDDGNHRVAVNPDLVMYVAYNVHDGSGQPMSRLVFAAPGREGTPHHIQVRGSVEDVATKLGLADRRRASTSKG